jgi:hypothetical protein
VQNQFRVLARAGRESYAVPVMTSRIIVLLLVLFGALHAGLAQGAAGSSVDPTLLLAPADKPIMFRVELHNPSVQDLVLNIGIALANGAKQYPNAVEYTLTIPDGRVLHLEHWEPAFIAGRVDPLIVPLPAGASFSFLVNLKEYVAPKEKIWKLQLAPGRYSLQAEYTGRAVPQSQTNLDVKGIALMPYWIGTVTSAPVVFTVPSDGGSPSDR